MQIHVSVYMKSSGSATNLTGIAIRRFSYLCNQPGIGQPLLRLLKLTPATRATVTLTICCYKRSLLHLAYKGLQRSFIRVSENDTTTKEK